MKAIEYQIEAVTNLHAGSGEVNFGVVDNLIQIDASTGFPIVNASSLKGALREHLNVSEKDLKDEECMYIFGSKPGDMNNREAGKFRFFDANLLSMPVRSNKNPYLMATCPFLVRDYISKRELFGLKLEENVVNRWEQALGKAMKGTPVLLGNSQKNVLVEDFEQAAANIGKEFDINDLRELIGENPVLVSDEDFLRLCDEDHLPVIARNSLAKGRENLWYEQVLPRFSRLYFYVLCAEEDKLFERFHMAITTGSVQIGANATVGYGYCKLTRRS